MTVLMTWLHNQSFAIVLHRQKRASGRDELNRDGPWLEDCGAPGARQDLSHMPHGKGADWIKTNASPSALWTEFQMELVLGRKRLGSK